MSEPVIERPVPPSLISRVIGIITAPRATFEKIVAAPRVGGALAIVVIVGAVMVGGFLMTKTGQDAWIDQQIDAQEQWSGQPMGPEQVSNLEKMAAYAGYFGAAQFLFMIPIGALILSGILFAIFNALMGGTATFKQVMSVVAHSWFIWALAFIVAMPIAYVKGTMTSSTSLGVLLPMLAEDSFAARLAGMLDVFSIWWLVVLSIGLGVLYKRKTSSVAMILFGIYGVILIGIASFLSSRS